MASQRQKPTIGARSRRRDCKHHWMLSDPLGDSVPGVCKRCGAQREFPVSLPPRVARTVSRG